MLFISFKDFFFSFFFFSKKDIQILVCSKLSKISIKFFVKLLHELHRLAQHQRGHWGWGLGLGLGESNNNSVHIDKCSFARVVHQFCELLIYTDIEFHERNIATA